MKLATAIGALRQGAVHSNLWKALWLGISPREVGPVVALSASTLGLPAAVAVFTWVGDVLGKRGKAKSARRAGTPLPEAMR